LDGRAAHGAQWISAEQAMEAMNASAAVAEARAQDVLGANPQDPQARLLLAGAFLAQRRWSEARAILEPLTQTQPHSEFAWRGLGQALARTGERTRAIAAFERALDLEIRGKEAWYALGSLSFPAAQHGRPEHHAISGDIERSLLQGRVDEADRVSRAALESHSGDPVALKLRADVLIEKSRWPEARPLLARALEIVPDCLSARFRYATMLFAHGEFAQCVPEFEHLIRSGVGTPLLHGARAVALGLGGDYSRAIEAFDSFITNCDSFPGLWKEYGSVLRWAGDRRMGSAFRRATEILPSYVSAWYALATVKSHRWDESLLGQLRLQVARPNLTMEDRINLHLVLGKALEDFGHYAEAFENFRAGKALLRTIADYWPKASQAAWHRTRLLFTPAFLRKHVGTGFPAPDPIFIIGLPRAGSTLVEQILSAHPQVEALGELTVLPTLVENLYTRAGGPQHWPLLLQRFSPGEFRAVGEEYLRMTRSLRESDAPFFTDKQPNNFQLTGLIHLMLPNAKIVDVRRHPLDCGFSCFKHYFPKGHRFARDLGDIGDRYVDYVRLMAHFDEVLPGRVYRVIYERLVDNFEGEVRRLLEYLGLPFESRCLQFFENRRRVITLSFEQVFMPLYQSGIGQWRHYEPWLTELKDRLGCILQLYPEVPRFFPDVHATSRAPRRLGESGGRFGTMKGVGQRAFVNVSGFPP
jgi:tetratricopeptide (TPR) repeat protein